MSNKKAVILLSGGLDSAVTFYLAKQKGFHCHCLIFDYGQRHRREIKSAKRLAKKAGCTLQVLKINLPWKGSTLFDKNIKIPKHLRAKELTSSIPSTYVPARNTIFLSFAVSYAEASSATAIFIGAHAQDYSGYPDCRSQFLAAYKKLMSVGTVLGREIKLIAPLLNKSKAEIIRLGAKLKVPFELTWSCYKGGKVPCGKCDSCYFRAKGFQEAGIPDPLLLLPKRFSRTLLNRGAGSRLL